MDSVEVLARRLRLIHLLDPFSQTPVAWTILRVEVFRVEVFRVEVRPMAPVEVLARRLQLTY